MDFRLRKGKQKLMDDFCINRKNAANCSLRFSYLYNFCCWNTEGDRNSEEDGDREGDESRGGHRHLQIGRMLNIDLISEPPQVPSPQMYVSKVWESVWPEGQEAIHS